MAILVLAAIVPSVLTAVTITPSAAFAISDSRKNSNTLAPQDESITRGAEPQTDHKLPTGLGHSLGLGIGSHGVSVIPLGDQNTPQDESITRGAEPQTDHKLPTGLGVAPISRNIAALGDK
jgi:hypothetical protein